MITNLALRNFQSWKKLDLELGPITVIVGRGMSGKSAIIRAIRYALTNRGGDSFIHEGQNEAAVALAFDNDTQVVWTKKRGKGGQYLLVTPSGKQKFSKTGTTVPEDIVAATGLRGITIDKDTVFPQFHSQWDAPFLLDESGTRTARILGKMTKLDRLVQAQINCRRDHGLVRGKIDSYQNEADRLDNVLKGLSALDPVIAKLDQAKAAIEDARTSYDQHEILTAALARIQTHATLSKRIGRIRTALHNANAAYDEAMILQETIKSYHDATTRLADAGLRVDRARENYEEALAAAREAEEYLCERCPLRIGEYSTSIP